MKLYHVTPSRNVPAIVTDGLRPDMTQSSQTAIYLAVDPSSTLDYVAMRSGEERGFTVLEVEIDDEDLLSPDDYELRDRLADMDEDELEAAGLFEDATWKDATWRQSIELCGQVAYLGPVPASALKVHGTVDATIIPLCIERTAPVRAPAP